MKDFQEFQKELLHEISFYSKEEIDFVKLSNEYWMELEDFMSLKELPSGIQTIYKKNFAWVGLHEFAVVFKNGNWMSYHRCDDPFYSEFVLNVQPTKPLKQLQNTLNNFER